MRKIRILQIIKGLDIGGDSGGAELFGIKLARELNKKKYSEVSICAFYSVDTEVEKEWNIKLNNEGIKTFFVSEWAGNNNLFKFLKGMIRLTKLIGNEKLDVVHSHFQLGTLAALILKLFHYTRTAFRTAHIRKEWSVGRWTWFLKPIFINRLFPYYLDGEVGVSKAVCNYLLDRNKKIIDPQKIKLIYNGIKIQEIVDELSKEENPKEIKLKNMSRIIGCVGRLAEQKGYSYLIEAMKIVASKEKDVILQIVGDGELKDQLVSLTRKFGLVDNIVFLGLRNDVPNILQHWDAFVLASLWEGFPTVVMEAMICKVPVIATNIPGTNELVIDGVTGLLVEPYDVDSLADRIIELLQNRQMRSLIISNAFDKVKKFDLGEIGDQYLELYSTNLDI